MSVTETKEQLRSSVCSVRMKYLIKIYDVTKLFKFDLFVLANPVLLLYLYFCFIISE